MNKELRIGNWIYEAVKEALSDLLEWLQDEDTPIGVTVADAKLEVVSGYLNDLSDLPTNECNLLTELAVYGLKS